MVANKLLKFLLTIFSAVKKKLFKEIVTKNATSSVVIHGADTATVDAGTYDFLNVVGDQDTVTPIRQRQTRDTNLSFADQDEEISSSQATCQNSILLWSVKTE